MNFGVKKTVKINIVSLVIQCPNIKKQIKRVDTNFSLKLEIATKISYLKSMVRDHMSDKLSS